ESLLQVGDGPFHSTAIEVEPVLLVPGTLDGIQGGLERLHEQRPFDEKDLMRFGPKRSRLLHDRAQAEEVPSSAIEHFLLLWQVVEEPLDVALSGDFQFVLLFRAESIGLIDPLDLPREARFETLASPVGSPDAAEERALELFVGHRDPRQELLEW